MKKVAIFWPGDYRAKPNEWARPQAEETTAANTLGAAPRPDLIHPGVRRYLREVGISR